MKKIIIYSLLACCALLSCTRKSYEDQVAEAAEEFTQKQCPREIDNCTTIDSMTFDRNTLTIHYYYTLKGRLDDKNSLTNSIIEDFNENMLLKLRGDIHLKKEKEYGITFAYHYISSSTGKVLMNLIYTKEDYTGPMSVHTFNYRETRNIREYCKAICPQRQDECTTLDSMWYDSISRSLHYDYSVNGRMDNDTIFNIDDFKKSLRHEIVKGIKSNTEISTERDKEHIDFIFRYFSSTSKRKLIEILVKNNEVTGNK